MRDLISRQAALDIINHELNGWLTDDERLHLEGVGTGIELLPSAQPKKGKWVFYPKATATSTLGLYPVCSECGHEHPVANFCPNCGADMRGEE